jgi:hypothetical protein
MLPENGVPIWHGQDGIAHAAFARGGEREIRLQRLG